MKSRLMKRSLFPILLLLTSQANASVVTGTLVQDYDHYYLSWSGGDFSADILANGWTGGSTGTGLTDSTLGLFEDDGSVGHLTGNLIQWNDDNPLGTADGSTSTLDSYIFVSNLAAGSYVLSVGTFVTIDSGGGSASSTYSRDISQPNTLYFTGDYQLTYGNPINSVPVPAAVWLFGSGLIGLVGLAQRKRAA